jgi:hypothetical protein
MTKYTKDTVTNFADTTSGWISNGVLIGALPLSSSGNYEVICTVVFPANTTASDCNTFGGGPPFTVVGGMQPPPPTNCCPSINLNTNIMGSHATFSTTSGWPAGCPNVIPTSFNWTVVDKSTGQSFTKTTTTPNTDETGFSPTLTLSPGTSYDVSVTPSYPGVSLPQGCNTASMPSTVTPTTTGGSTSCPWWCWLLGIVAIAIPISAFVSSVADCRVTPLWQTISAAAIALAIYVFTRICSVCCLWVIIIIGLVLAIIAYIVAIIIEIYYGVFNPMPGCIANAAAIFIGYLTSAGAFKMACDAMASSGSSGSSSSGLTSTDGHKSTKSHTHRRVAMEGPVATPRLVLGLGDAISAVAASMHVQPCSGCQKRRDALNAIAPLKFKRG